MDVLKALLRSRKFWLAVFGVVQSVVFAYIPDFPDEVWQAINALVMAVIIAIAVEDHGTKSAGVSRD